MNIINSIRTLWLLFCQGMRKAWRDASDDLMVDECAHCAQDLTELIRTPYVSDDTVRRWWLKLMRDHESDPMFPMVIGGIINDLTRCRPGLKEECVPSEPPPRLIHINPDIKGDVEP